ncbi:MAG TPA: TMEM165/GDT1 family protein [Acidimicrobiia bacterium]|nr:TMEM165/GDT1 family protein [Acidimicrobiia bacterium]
MHPSIVAAVFPVIFVGELPDKTMFATVVMASRGNPRAVWLGAATAFAVHVVIATTIGVGLVHILPHRAVEALVAGLFALGAVYMLRESDDEEEDLVAREARSHRRVITTAFAVIFVAEWGDLTQILVANLAAHYHAAVSVGLGSALALWSVAGIGVIGGQGVLRVIPIRTMHRLSAALLAILAIVSAMSAVRG